VGIRDQRPADPGDAKYFAQFTRQALVRGNFKDRVEAHVALVNAGIETVDEARDVEEMPKRGGKADELREPQNITGKPRLSRRPSARRASADALVDVHQTSEALCHRFRFERPRRVAVTSSASRSR
jgi:hypothetical protein